MSFVLERFDKYGWNSALEFPGLVSADDVHGMPTVEDVISLARNQMARFLYEAVTLLDCYQVCAEPTSRIGIAGQFVRLVDAFEGESHLDIRTLDLMAPITAILYRNDEYMGTDWPVATDTEQRRLHAAGCPINWSSEHLQRFGDKRKEWEWVRVNVLLNLCPAIHLGYQSISQCGESEDTEYSLAVSATEWRASCSRSLKLILDATNNIYSGLAKTERWSQRRELRSPLTENDRCLLSAMLQLDAGKHYPKSGSMVVGTALYSGDTKRAFDNLLANGLVKSKTGRGGGYWLTGDGRLWAEYLSGNGATV
tara:strand:- start:307 stop:1236 length:930 start_codon:yes stop_codon:yes gene_type:complete